MTTESCATATDGAEPNRSADYSGASVDAISHHYDLSNDFYALWLDPTLTYSCAMWDGPDDDLATAQKRKLDYLATGAGAAGSSRVLDVGCGWGALMTRLVDVHNVEAVTGLTLSARQVEYVQQIGDSRLDVRLENWSDHRPEQPYDAIISIGAMEHFASLGLTRPQRITAYRRFFEKCVEWLVPDGRLGLQTIVRGNNTDLDWSMVREMVFVNSQIFRESEVPWISEVMEASEGLLDLVSLRNDRAHYDRTCDEWLTRLSDNREQALEMVGRVSVEKYERYLRASIRAFRDHHGGLARLIFERV